VTDSLRVATTPGGTGPTRVAVAGHLSQDVPIATLIGGDDLFRCPEGTGLHVEIGCAPVKFANFWSVISGAIGGSTFNSWLAQGSRRRG
jgi:hypothetical protein